MSFGDFSPDFRDQLDTLFRLRRDVRRFKRAPVAPDLVDRVFQTMASAPSVGLSQPWRVVMFETEAAQQAAQKAFQSANREALAAQPPHKARSYAALKLEGMDAAPCQFALFVDLDGTQGGGLGRQSMPEMLHYSAVCAVMQVWLTARAHGLGLGWVSILDVETLKKAAQAPEAWDLIGYFCLGWPEREADAVPDLERAAWERRQPPASWMSSV